MNTVLIWLLVAIGVIVIDLLTSTFLFVWFSVGAIAAIIAGFGGMEMPGQIIVFAIFSAIAIAVGYPWAKKKYKKNTKRVPLMEETYVGKTYTAEEDIYDVARIKVGGIYWTGINRGHIIAKGEKFKIIGIEGNKFLIEEYKGEEECN